MPHQYFSPLRYPGGKAFLTDFLAKLIEHNNIKDCIYVEPFAGGAGAALGLLLTNQVKSVILNDLDCFIYNFWYSILNHTEDFLRLIHDTPITLEQWQKQRSIFKSTSLTAHSPVDIGFCAFFLNRCNRSGILYAGPIGGQKQDGAWKLDVRFKKHEMVKRIQRIAEFAHKIEIHNEDAIDFIGKILKINRKKSDLFFYIDPPYFVNGKKLYPSYCDADYHKRLAKFILSIKRCKWLVSYDDVPEVHDLYLGQAQILYPVRYKLYKNKKEQEVFISNAHPDNSLQKHLQ